MNTRINAILAICALTLAVIVATDIALLRALGTVRSEYNRITSKLSFLDKILP